MHGDLLQPGDRDAGLLQPLGGAVVVKIVVSEEQARAMADASGSVEIVDSSGHRLGFFARPFTDQDIAIARQRAASDEPRRTTKQVLERLKSLEQE